MLPEGRGIKMRLWMDALKKHIIHNLEDSVRRKEAANGKLSNELPIRPWGVQEITISI